MLQERNQDAFSTVYVLKNEGMPGLLKIGRTDKAEPDTRMSNLYTTGVPYPFECVKAVRVDNADEAKALETALHTTFDQHRVNPKREFFAISEEEATAILSIWPNAVDATPEAQGEVDSGTDEIDKSAIQKARKRRPDMRFSLLGIEIGDTLTYKRNHDILARVIDLEDNMVEFQGETLPLRSATRKAFDIDSRALTKWERQGSFAQSDYWLWKGKVLYQHMVDAFPR